MDRQEEAQREFNLLVLKKKDDQVTSIVTHSSHVAVYVFNKESKDWVRKGIEGAMFVVQRKSAPEFQLIVQNRLANNTFVEPVGGPQYEVQEKAPFLLIQNHSGEIHGLWFYEGAERANVLQVLQGLAARATSVPAGHPPSAQPAPDIMALLQGHTQQQQQQQQQQQHGSQPHGAKAVSVSQLFAAAAGSPAPAVPAQPSSPHPQDLPQPSRMMAPGGMAQPMAQTVLAAGGARLGSKQELAEQLRRLADSPAFVDLVWNEYQKL